MMNALLLPLLGIARRRKGLVVNYGLAKTDAVVFFSGRGANTATANLHSHNG